MTKGVIITGSRWATPSDAATFPAWHFYQQFKDSIGFNVWAEEVLDGKWPEVHSLQKSIPRPTAGIGTSLKCILGASKDSSGFSPAMLKACDESDFILLFYRGATHLTDFVLRSWGKKTLVHLTDNLLLHYARGKQYRYGIKAILEQFHIATRPSLGIVFVAETDKKWFAKLFPWRNSDTHAIALGVDTEVFYPADECDLNNRSKCRFLFAGDLSYAPNTKACQYIIDNIVPALPHQSTMVFAGKNPPDFVTQAAAANPMLEVTGFVQDISKVYRDCDVLLAPIFGGAGMQNKLLEASASGLPCITSNICNAAFTIQPPNFLLGDETSGLMAHVESLASNKWLRMDLGVKGRSYVVKHCSWQSRAKKILDLALPGIKNL
jgi:glycosyltransferase involved in cell wall biosynthesis